MMASMRMTMTNVPVLITGGLTTSCNTQGSNNHYHSQHLGHAGHQFTGLAMYTLYIERQFIDRPRAVQKVVSLYYGLLTVCRIAYQPIIDAVRTVLSVKIDSAG